jgi:hypothetical protein
MKPDNSRSQEIVSNPPLVPCQLSPILPQAISVVSQVAESAPKIPNEAWRGLDKLGEIYENLPIRQIRKFLFTYPSFGLNV